MRVLFIANTNSPHTEKWALGLLRLGLEVHLFSIDPVQKELPWRKLLNTHFAPATKDKFLPRKYRVLLRELKQRIIQIKPDIVHAHYLSNYASLALLAGFKPLCVTAWGSDVYQYPNQNFINRALLKWVLAKANGVISTSNAMRLELLKYTAKEITVIPFGIDFASFSGSSNSSDFSVIRIAIFKRLEKVYGIDTAIKALAQLQNNLPNQKIELSIVGSGSQEAQLKLLSQQLRLSNSVNFMPWCEPQEVPAVLKQQHICLYLSERESFGVALIEAMAAQKHLVVSDIPAFREVGQGYNAITYVDSQNLSEIVKALVQSINSCITQSQLPSNDAIYKRYDLMQTLKSQIDFYKHILAAGKRN